jgi:hypothetical protein
MKKAIFCLCLFLSMSLSGLAQMIGTGADSTRLSLQFSYEHLSREFSFSGMREDIGRDVFAAAAAYKPALNFTIYGFLGTSDFPMSLTPGGQHLLFGGGLKYSLLGYVDIEKEDGSRVNIKGAIDFDVRASRLLSSSTDFYEKFGLTQFQGSIVFGLKVFEFAGSMGFKFSRVSGEFFPGLQLMIFPARPVEVDGRGLLSFLLGFNYQFAPRLSLVTEFSFFTESSWSFGLRWDIDRR